MPLKNKTILIISPNDWGNMHISKHHYAIELAKKGNQVYFFNPPSKKIFGKTRVNTLPDNENLKIVNYFLYFPYILRFHLRGIFDLLLKIRMKYLINSLAINPDIVWCFETNVFGSLKIFSSKIRIYHPVDMIEGTNQKKLIKSADYIFSVSEVIIEKIKSIYAHKQIYFINHGLSEQFCKKRDQIKRNESQISAYFVGNLMIKSLDTAISKKIISENPHVVFNFIGPYTMADSNVGGNDSEESRQFIAFLKNKKNVVLKGVMPPKDLVSEIQKADIFLVLINPEKDQNKGSNSHKVLEYLSTGKVIVANHLSSLLHLRDIIAMPAELSNNTLPDIFKDVVNKLQKYNTEELQQKRKQFALDNTYRKQIDRIEKIINPD